jgi:hypothetical protein
MTVRIRQLSDPDTYGSVQSVQKSYKTAANAEKAAMAYLGDYGEGWDANATVASMQRADGRYVPICIFQGNDAVQLCINSARNGFMSFA